MELIVLRDGREHRLEVTRGSAGYEVRIDGQAYMVDSAVVHGAVRSLLIAGEQHEVAVRRRREGRYSVSSRGAVDEVEVLDPLAYLASQGADRKAARGAQRVEAYMPGRVVEVLVREGEPVTAGQGLVVLEAMKMENEIRAEGEGVVRKVLVAAGQAVEGGDLLFELDPG